MIEGHPLAGMSNCRPVWYRCLHNFFGPLAQWLEQRPHKPLVIGSSPVEPTNLTFSKTCGIVINMGDSFIRDRTGHIIGRNDGSWLRDGHGNLVARFDKSDNRTRDREGKIVGTGDQRMIELGRRLDKK
jgi:hypothetical protein